MPFVPTMLYRPKWASLAITETGSEPLTTAELKDVARVETDAEDALVARFGKAARLVAESMTNRAIAEQTRVLKMSEFPTLVDQYFELPGGYVQSVSSIAYTDENGDAQTFTDFMADTGGDTGTARVYLAADAEWPAVADRGLPVTVTFVAGYSPSASPAIEVPDDVKTLIGLLTADLYENRAVQSEIQLHPNVMVKFLVSRLRVWCPQ